MNRIAKIIAVPVLMFAMLLPVIASVNASTSRNNVAPALSAKGGSPYPQPVPGHPLA